MPPQKLLNRMYKSILYWRMKGRPEGKQGMRYQPLSNRKDSRGFLFLMGPIATAQGPMRSRLSLEGPLWGAVLADPAPRKLPEADGCILT